MARGIHNSLSPDANLTATTRGVPWWLTGALALFIIALLTLLPLAAMIVEAGDIDWAGTLGNTYIQRVVWFSVTQATWSTVLALVSAIPVALALSHKQIFIGRNLIVALFSLSLVIPTIVAIYGIVAVFGRTGWISSALSTFAWEPLNFYGLPGILIAHVFFNMPLAARVILVSLQGIPQEQWRLARQIGMGPIALFRFIEWPAIRGQIPSLALLIFTLCFTSFAIVMTLGGGPRATTIEVAIYQSLRFDFDISQAVALASIQLLICIGLMALSTLVKHNRDLHNVAFAALPKDHQTRHQHALNRHLSGKSIINMLHWMIIIVASVFVLLPILALILSAINPTTLSVLSDHNTLRALLNTIIVSLISALIAVLLAIFLLLSTRHLRIRLLREKSGQWLQLAGNVILVLPPLVIGTGLFLLLRPFADVFALALVLVIVINSLMALPFALRVLDTPMTNAANQHDRLLQSLGLFGWNRWRWIDWPQLRQPIGLSMAISATLSAGDLSAIALFGSEQIRTLPLLLYQRMGSYRLEEAAVTAGMLLLLCLTLFMSLQLLIGGRTHVEA